MNLYPIMANIEGRLIVVIGGGEVAARKVIDLLNAGARVKVVSPEINPNIAEIKSSNLEIVQRPYSYGDLQGAFLVFSATNSREVNAAVFKEASQLNIFINAVDDPENCSFFVPSFFTKGDPLVAVSTGGASPSYAAKIRRLLERSIPENAEAILRSLRLSRDLLKSDPKFSHLDSPTRGRILKNIVEKEELLNEIALCHNSEELAEFLLKLI